MLDVDDEELRFMLAKARTIAIVGARDNPGRPVDRVGRYLIESGYIVLPVHPVRKTVWGLTCYPDLTQIDHPVDIVNVFRAPEHCPEHAREALRLVPLPTLFWMQSGIENKDAAALLTARGVKVVQNACLMVEHRRFFPAASSHGVTI